MNPSLPKASTEGLNSTLAVPLKLGAFVFNEPVCDGGELDAKIAPVTQPNYTFLRLTNFIIQNDIVPHVSLHNTIPPTSVYVHWMLPRVYRSGVAATESGPDNRQRERLPEPEQPDNADDSVPQFRPVPTRWLVIRRLHPTTAQPANSGIPEFQAWVVESDRKRDIKDIPYNVDLQVDVSPFVHPTRRVNIEEQAEAFIGMKFPAKGWKEDEEADRVALNVLNGGNLLFTDFQQHNGNVFSILDNFSYSNPLDNSRVLYLKKAKASYYVIGWHPKDNQDPFHIVQQAEPLITRSDRLANCQMTLSDTTSPNTDHDTWLSSTVSATVVCRGAMYDVEWDISQKPKNVPADSHSHDLQNHLPVAVGATPLDSVLAYIHAHRDGGGDEDLQQVIDSIMFIQKYLINQDESVDGQQQAQDLLHAYNYDALTGGTHYHLAGSEDSAKPAQKPSPMVAEKLAELNREQFRLDALKRTAKRVQWELFSLWWKFVCEGANHNSYRDQVVNITSNWAEIRKGIEESTSVVDRLLAEPRLKIGEPGVLPSFHQQRDPTILVGNVESAWPQDWLENLKVRLNTEITAWADRGQLGDTGGEVGIPSLPTTIQETAKALVKEFINLGADTNTSPPEHTLVPLYHDQGLTRNNNPAPWRDQWESTQPWFPLFLEWEVEYSHLPFSSWLLEERLTADEDLPELRYGIRDDTVLFNLPDKSDKRSLSGRVLILPQPSFSLQSKITQLFENMPETERDKILPKEERKQLFENLHRLDFLSSPLAGFHDHLLTMVQGSHVKPNVRYSDEKLLAIDSAINALAGFEREEFDVIGDETDLTPYGTMVQFYDLGHSAFKPATHGQFKLTKLNIIDKFGQAIHAIDPRWSSDPPPPLYPCLSEFYAPQLVESDEGETVPNTIEKQHGGLNEFAQTTPHINQMARLNAAFVKRNNNGISWVPQTEWESPIWGWLVINYIQHSIQIFLADGTFYREVRLGGQSGTSTSDQWLPFDRSSQDPSSTQLDHLIRRLGDRGYLQAFVDMINGSLQHAATAPDAYAQFLNSVVGKPLVLVNIGWSLELAEDAYVNQSTLNDAKLRLWLLSDPRDAQRELYSFPFKLGDRERSFDGLVGYFKTLEEQDDGNDLVLDQCYTYYGIKNEEILATGSPLVQIDKDNFPTLHPYFVNPKDSSTLIESQRNSKLSPNTFGVIIDPFTAVHAYSGILPTQSIKLPPWTWQEALSRMTAFFHMGPLVITGDVPDYDSQYKLQADYDLRMAERVPNSAVGVPAMAAAEWDWLQAYSVVEGSGREDEERTAFMPLGLGHTDTRPRFEEAPYTVVEGYLQLKQPIIREL